MHWLKRLPAGRVVALAGILSLVVFIVWIGAVYLWWLLFGPVEHAWDLWAIGPGDNQGIIHIELHGPPIPDYLIFVVVPGVSAAW